MQSGWEKVTLDLCCDVWHNSNQDWQSSHSPVCVLLPVPSSVRRDWRVSRGRIRRRCHTLKTTRNSAPIDALLRVVSGGWPGRFAIRLEILLVDSITRCLIYSGVKSREVRTSLIAPLGLFADRRVATNLREVYAIEIE